MNKIITCSKITYYYKNKEWRVTMVCADIFRAGSLHQLKQNAVKIKVPFCGSYFNADSVIITEKGVAEFKNEEM